LHYFLGNEQPPVVWRIVRIQSGEAKTVQVTPNIYV